jgi:phage terminase large subunit-like protein
MQVPGGPRIGSPFVLEDLQREFWDEALELVEDPITGELRRVYNSAGRIQPRKTGKTTELGAFSLYAAGPWDGEYRPVVIQAAGSRGQAGELFDQTTAFINDPAGGSRELRSIFVPRQISITCPQTRGVIRRVAGDGKLNHSLNPHLVVADELFAWKTRRQRENWKALTTAQGAREDPMVVFISAEGEDEDDVLFDLMERIGNDPQTEVEIRHRCFRIYRNREAGLLVYQHSAPAGTPFDDLETIQLAQAGASWRTKERIAKDLADPFVDDLTKRRLYLGQRTAGAGRWITDERWDECRSSLEIPSAAIVAVGVDGARTRDTTARVIAWKEPKSGRIAIRSRVWSAIEVKPHDVLVPGGRLDNNLVRNEIRDAVMDEWTPRLLFYDERYFDTQANDLSNDGLVVVEMHQGKPEMQAAWDLFYALIHEGHKPRLAHDGDLVLRQHVRNAVGVKTERGWKVSKVKSDKPIDALAAAVMAVYAAEHLDEFMGASSGWRPL